MKKITTEEFIERALKIHKHKYDYSNTIYIDGSTQVIIRCPYHGEFKQISKNHLQGRGCLKCGYKKKPFTTEEFINRAKKTHGNKYDYSISKYITTKTKIDINCKTHGKFSQIAGEHLKGSGCPKCYGGVAYKIEDFINKALSVHGNKYDYSKVIYKKAHIPVIISCPNHGDFLQQPESHLSGAGCIKCAGIERATTKSFIQKALNVHGNKYDYSKVVYKQSFIKILIICPQHGEFKQSPQHHLEGMGCNICAKEYSRKKQTMF